MNMSACDVRQQNTISLKQNTVDGKKTYPFHEVLTLRRAEADDELSECVDTKATSQNALHGRETRVVPAIGRGEAKMERGKGG
jgi:hypothetical protein